MVKILFICKYNRFRSRVAESYFNKINKNKKIKVKSAGLIRGRPVSKIEASVAKKLGVGINGKPKGLSSKLLMWQDLSIIVANDVLKEVLENEKYGKKTIVWKIKDAEDDDVKKLEKIINEIKKRVERLVEELK